MCRARPTFRSGAGVDARAAASAQKEENGMRDDHSWEAVTRMVQVGE
jgi:hypothetical protein